MPTISERQTYRLISAIYDSAAEPDLDSLRSNLMAFVDLLGGVSTSLSYKADGEANLSSIADNYMTDDDRRKYADHFSQISPFRQALFEARAGDVVVRRSILGDNDFRKTEVYNDFLKRLGVFNFEYYSVFNEKGLIGGVSFATDEKQGRLTRSQHRAITTVLPHFGKAFRSFILGKRLDIEKRVLDGALGRIPRGLMVLKDDMTLEYSNASAQRLLTSSDGISIGKNGRLTANDAKDTTLMTALVSSVFAPDLAGRAAFGGALRVRRASGKRPLELVIVPLSGTQMGASPHLRFALVFVTDHELEVRASEQVLMDMYGLTAAEAMICKLIAQLRTLPEICEELGITENTVRTHLKRIFSKTETRRQSELVKLIIDGPSRLAF